jgi:hypothetical protein
MNVTDRTRSGGRRRVYGSMAGAARRVGQGVPCACLCLPSGVEFHVRARRTLAARLPRQGSRWVVPAARTRRGRSGLTPTLTHAVRNPRTRCCCLLELDARGSRRARSAGHACARAGRTFRTGRAGGRAQMMADGARRGREIERGREAGEIS